MVTEQDIISSMEEVLKEMSSGISEAYGTTVGANKSKAYVKTGELKRALNHPVIDVNGNNLVYTLYDIDEIKPSPSKASWQFNHHMSWDYDDMWEGNYIPESVPEWLDLGFTIVYGNNRIKYKGKHFFEQGLGISNVTNINSLNNKIEDILTDKLAQRIINKIKRKGGVG